MPSLLTKGSAAVVDSQMCWPLNHRIAGEEADLSWPRDRLIVEIDGGPFHLDVGEDERKQSIWEQARWTVRRIDSDDVYERPHLLLALCPH
jgi:very-short-patch-repair endonuclease